MNRESKNSISETFCVLPWIHLSTRPNGHLRCCCTACASSAAPILKNPEVGYIKNEQGRPANLNTCDLLTAWNNDYMKNIRVAMLNGQIPPSCEKCFKEEKAGLRSKRMWETEYWSSRVDIGEMIEKTSPDGSIAPNINYVDLRLGTKCDLKCIMCSPHDSSEWIPDWLKLYPQITSERLKQIMIWKNYGRTDGATYDWYRDNNKFWSQFYEQIPNLKQLYFAGGESLVIDRHYQLLKECIRQGHAKNITLRYNSNGLALSDELFKLWQPFKRVRFGFSIDSIGEMNSYIRFPSRWETIENNLDILDRSEDNIEITIAFAIQILNIYYLPDFIKWKLKKNYKKINLWPNGAGLINTHFVYHPAHLNVKVLPPWYKDKVAEKYENFYGWLLENHRHDGEFVEHPYGINRLKGIIKFMYSENWSSLLGEFKEYITLMDEIRNTDFKKVFPEMKKIIDQNDAIK